MTCPTLDDLSRRGRKDRRECEDVEKDREEGEGEGESDEEVESTKLVSEERRLEA